jgi:aryl-alcohol dehydrogenase-like predicted oxidoreductase
MKTMDTVQLGTSGTEVSRAALGTMLMGTVMPRDESFRALDHFMERGGTMLDTANCYAWWVGKGENVGDESEALLGDWMAERKNRERVFLATKCGARLREAGMARDADGTPRWDEAEHCFEGASRKAILAAVEGSLKRLKTDYIDLFYIHVDDRRADLEETLGTLNELVLSGVIRHIGYSNVRAWRLERMRGICEKHGWASPAAIQQEFSYLRPATGEGFGVDVHVDDSFLDYSAENPWFSLVAYSPLLKGIYSSEAKRLAFYNWPKFDTKDSAERLARLDAVSRRTGLDGNTLVLAWMLALKPAVIPIIGGSRFSHFEENLRALDVRLDEGDVKFLGGE